MCDNGQSLNGYQWLAKEKAHMIWLQNLAAFTSILRAGYIRELDIFVTEQSLIWKLSSNVLRWIRIIVRPNKAHFLNTSCQMTVFVQNLDKFGFESNAWQWQLQFSSEQ